LLTWIIFAFWTVSIMKSKIICTHTDLRFEHQCIWL
jgi:hypothetical protein